MQHLIKVCVHVLYCTWQPGEAVRGRGGDPAARRHRRQQAPTLQRLAGRLRRHEQACGQRLPASGLSGCFELSMSFAAMNLAQLQHAMHSPFVDDLDIDTHSSCHQSLARKAHFAL